MPLSVQSSGSEIANTGVPVFAGMTCEVQFTARSRPAQ